MKQITQEEFIEIFPVFSKSPKSLFQTILETSQLKQFPGNTTFYTDGDACEGIGLFLSGEVRVYKIGESGREITLYEIYPGETCILNASSILSKKHYPANAVSLTDGEVLFLSDKTFWSLISEFGDMREFIFKLFSQRFAEIMELVEEVAFGKMDSRLADYLIQKSENRMLQTTHQSIANELGTSREVVSRLLKDFEKKGDVSLSRNMITLINL